MKMTTRLKNIVSKNRKRYIDDEFNLDLSYITPNVIAMGFPSEKIEGIYRNHIDDVVRFFEKKHSGCYRVYNLCSERSYDINKFHGRVAVYPFNDHNPPRIELIQKFCEDVHGWLNACANNVVAVHCKAGKGRTGTMICSYMLYSGRFETAADSLNYYGQQRTNDLKGVTIPSQRRYVEYYAKLLSMSHSRHIPCLSVYRPPLLSINEIIIQPPPILNGGQGTIDIFIYQDKTLFQKVTLSSHEVRKGSTSICFRPDKSPYLIGNIKIEVKNNRAKIKFGKDKLFHFWFNTFFVEQESYAVKEESGNLILYRLTFDKWQLDDAHKDKQHKFYTPDFKVQLALQYFTENSTWKTTPEGVSDSISDQSQSSSSADDETDGSQEAEGWDSAIKGPAGGTGGLLSHYRLLSEPDLDNIPNNMPNTLTTTPQPEVEPMLFMLK